MGRFEPNEPRSAGPRASVGPDALGRATERLVDAATSTAPGALEAALLDVLEAGAGHGRATLWRTGREANGLGGPRPWILLRARGEVTPTPDAAAPHGTDWLVLHGVTLGSLVLRRAPFDDGWREEREDAAEALFLCAESLAGGAGAGIWGLGEAPWLDALPGPLPAPERGRDDAA